MPKQDDSRPFDHIKGEQPVFSPELQSEKMREIQEAAVLMTSTLNDYMRKNSYRSIDDLYDDIFCFYAVRTYLSLAGEILGRPFVKQAFSMAIRNYINSKE